MCEGKKYWIGEKIGEGAFGTTFACQDEWDNSLVVKVLHARNRPYEEIKQNWLDELLKLQTLRHPNVTFLHAAFEYQDTFYIVLERCSFTLETVIASASVEGDKWIRYIARDILNGLDHIHTYSHVHKDIHPGNVFVSQVVDRMVPSKPAVWIYKIGDLGISRIEEEIRAENSVFANSRLPPEVLNQKEFGPVGKHVDIYHVGLLLLGLALKQIRPFTEQETLEGLPRRLAEECGSKFAGPIAKALRRHVSARTQSALEFWREIREIP